MYRSLVWMVCIAGCGRSGFDPHDATSSACIAQISAGGGDTCVLRGDGTIWCWGANGFGELGDGTVIPSSLPVEVLVAPGGDPFTGAVQISGGVEETTCARRGDGTAWCWGQNTNGQLGDGATGGGTPTGVPSPVQVMASQDTPFTDVAELVMGEQHACAIKTDSTLWCWGLNDVGQLGGSGLQASPFPVQVTLPTLAPLTGAVGVMVSYKHTCSWDAAGNLSCWGSNTNGQLGDGSTMNRPFPVPVPLTNVTQVSSSDIHTCALLNDSTVFCFGDDEFGQLGDGNVGAMQVPTPTEVDIALDGVAFAGSVEIGLGDRTSCALKSDGTVWCWGDNSGAELGIGALTPAMSASPIQALLPSAASALAVGNGHACAVLAGDAIRCWGDNTYGQLGAGTTGTPVDLPVAALYTCP